MSYEQTRQAFSILNGGLRERYQAGNPVRLTISGRPVFRVLSFEPLACETYGTFRNRAPYLAGELALRGFITKPDVYSDGVIVFAGVAAGDQSYAFVLDGNDPRAINTMNGVALTLGLPDLRLNQSRRPGTA